MEPRKSYKKINDSTRLNLFGQEGARESLVRKPKKIKQHDPEKEYLKQEVIHLKGLLLEHTKEISV
ncbi:MAG: hypothetical protein AABY49_07615 [Planctomycetota bacterium]